MPAQCPEGITQLVASIPLRLTNNAVKLKAVNPMVPLTGSVGVTLAICDGTLNEKEDDDGLLPGSMEKGLDSDDRRNHPLSTREKLERLRMAVKKQDAEKKGEVDTKKEEVVKNAEDAKKEDRKEKCPQKSKQETKHHNTKKKTTEKKNGKCDKSEEKKHPKENEKKQKEKQHDQDKCETNEKKHAKQKLAKQVVPKEDGEKDKGKKRKALSMTKKCYTSRAYHVVYDLAKKNGDPEAKAKARDASFKAGLQWEDLYGEHALVSACT